MSSLPQLVRAEDIATRLGVKPGTILDWWEAGLLPGFRLTGRVGAPVRFREEEVIACLERWRGGPPVDVPPEQPLRAVE